MKRKDKRPKRDSNGSPNGSPNSARPRATKQAPREVARRAATRDDKPSAKRKARRTGRTREPATSRVEARRDHKPQPPVLPKAAAELPKAAVELPKAAIELPKAAVATAKTVEELPKALAATAKAAEEHPKIPVAIVEERHAVDEVGFGDSDSDSDFDTEEAFELGIGSRIVPLTTQYADAFESTPPDPEEHKTGDVQAQIRALEARLDGLIRQRVNAPAQGAADVADAADAEPISERRGSLARTPSAPPAKVELPLPLSGDFISRKWGRSALRSQSQEFDDFGLDPNFEQRVRPVVEFLYRSYFRTTVEGIDHVPADGRCIVVANHSGAVPLDGLMLRAALRIEHPQKRDLRWLAEDFVYYLPFAGVFMNRVGAVRACPENAERLLEKESLVGVFPEGVHGIKKLFQERYRLQRFGRGGYIRLCLRMRAPIVPCAIIGAEESSPLLYRLEGLTELLGLPYFPVTPTFPFLGLVGLLPAPTKWRMRFGEPIHLDNYGPEAADDHVLVGRLSERVRSSIQAMLDSGLRERRSVWFG